MTTKPEWVFVEDNDAAFTYSPWEHGLPFCTNLYLVDGGVLYNAGEDAWGASFDIPIRSYVLASTRSTAKRLFIDFWNSEYDAELSWIDKFSIRLQRRCVVCVEECVVDFCYDRGGIDQALLDIMREWSQG